MFFISWKMKSKGCGYVCVCKSRYKYSVCSVLMKYIYIYCVSNVLLKNDTSKCSINFLKTFMCFSQKKYSGLEKLYLKIYYVGVHIKQIRSPPVTGNAICCELVLVKESRYKNYFSDISPC